MHNRLVLILILASVTCCCGCSTVGATEPAPALFDRHELLTGLAARQQTVVTGFFRARATADIAVLYVDRQHQRHLRLFGFDNGGWQRVLDATLPPATRFVDVARIGDRDRLVVYASGQLSWLDPERGALNPMVAVTTTYNPNPKPHEAGTVQHLEVMHDLNGDGRDDVLLPDIDGFWVAVQLHDGTLSDPVKIGPPEPFIDAAVIGERRTYRDAGISVETLPWYLGRAHRLDCNGDGLRDLVFWNSDHFDAYLQDAGGRFALTPTPFATNVAFDADGVYSHLFAYQDEGPLKLLLGIRARSKRTVLFAFRDMNADGLADLITQTIEGRSLTNQRTTYAIHFGALKPEGLTFTQDAGATIRPAGRAGGMQASGYAWQLIEDFDGDGHADIMFAHVTVSLGGVVRSLTGNSVPVDLEFHRGTDGSYPAIPTLRHSIRRFAPFAGVGNIFFPNVLVGDVTGDGRADLLVGERPTQLDVFVGEPGPGLFADHPQRIEVALPPDERNAWLVDLNGDAKQDILIHNGPTAYAPEQPHRIMTLIAR